MTAETPAPPAPDDLVERLRNPTFYPHPTIEDGKAAARIDALPAVSIQPMINAAVAAALREAAAIAQDYHDKAIEWAKTVRGLEQHISETDSLRIANAILAEIGEEE